MRILANENIPGPVVTSLRGLGHDVAWVAESMPGASDHEVIGTARTENRILITFDKDFGELAFRFGLPAASGIVYFRLTGTNPQEDNDRAVSALTSRDDWTGTFAIVHDDRIRIRSLPNSS